MDLKSYFDKALRPKEFESRLEDNKKLHETHYNRAEVDDYKDKLKTLPPFKLLIITEPWCGDSLAVTPVVLKMLENTEVEIKIALRDENLELIDNYLTKGGRAIPKFIVMDEDFNEKFNWGPRPTVAQDIFEAHRSQIEAGEIEKVEVHKKIRAFYGHDKGKCIAKEFGEALIETFGA